MASFTFRNWLRERWSLKWTGQTSCSHPRGSIRLTFRIFHTKISFVPILREVNQMVDATGQRTLYNSVYKAGVRAIIS